MEVMKFIKDYWVLITGLLVPFLIFIYAMIQATKCSLRNDILSIYDHCKDKKQITLYQFQAIMYSYKIYKLLRGNSFVEEIIEKVKSFELID